MHDDAERVEYVSESTFRNAAVVGKIETSRDATQNAANFEVTEKQPQQTNGLDPRSTRKQRDLEASQSTIGHERDATGLSKRTLVGTIKERPTEES